MRRLRLRFFEVAAEVECADEPLGMALERLYRRAGDSQPGRTSVRCQIDLNSGVTETVDGLATPLALGALSGSAAHGLLFGALAARVRSHWMLHAAAVAGPDGGVLLVGDSGQGKTTLALALAQRGYGWLSDEVGALERSSGLLKPFPRAALVRPGTLDLLPNLGSRMEPWPLPEDGAVGCWHPPESAAAAPLRHVFVLPAPAVEGPTQVSVSSVPPALAHVLARDPQLAGGAVLGANACTVVTWPHPLSPRALWRWSEACREAGVTLLNVHLPEGCARFAGPPRVAPCSASAVWMALARSAWNRPDPASPHLRQEMAAFLRDLAVRLQTARRHLLQPGPLDDTVALIERVCGGKQAAKE